MRTPGLRLPWTRTRTAIEPGSNVVIQGTYLELRRLRDAPVLFLWSSRVRRQVLKSPGALGITLRAHPLARRYYTVSAWRDEESLRRFVRSAAHREAMHLIPELTTGAGRFPSWHAPSENMRPRWGEVFNRIDATRPSHPAATANEAR
jgi:hypothetical protein